MGILLESAILQGPVGRYSFVCANVASKTLVMYLVIDTAVGSSRYSAGSVEAILKARLLQKYCNYSGHIPGEGQSSGTCCAVACIERIRMLCTGLWRVSSPVRSTAVNGSSRSRWYSVAISKEGTGRRTLTAALLRHMVGLRICGVGSW